MTLQESTLEDTSCSTVRLKILKLLAESQKLTTYEIAARTGINYVLTRAHLNVCARNFIGSLVISERSIVRALDKKATARND